MSNFFDRLDAKHRQRFVADLAAGLHDDACEQRERSYICHCAYRRRIAAGRTTPPTITFPAPECSEGHELDFDGDTFTCSECSVDWCARATEGDQGEFYDHYGEQFGGEQFGARLIEVVAP